MNLKIKSRTTKVNDSVIIEKMIADIKEHDSDTLSFLIEQMYPVKASYDEATGEFEISVDETQVSEDTTLKDIF